jgi:hypothetical protein
MAQPGQQIQSALMRDPRAGRQAPAPKPRQLPASTFRKVNAPPQRYAPPKTGGMLESGGGEPQRVGIGQFEQNQFNRPAPAVNDQYLKPPPPGFAAGIVGGAAPAVMAQYPQGQVGIGQFEQSQFRPLPIQSPMIGGNTQLPAPNYANQFMQGVTAAPLTGTMQQSPTMNQANQIAQGATAGFGQGLMKR